MKTLVVYDSVHGNTEKIAQAIGEAIPGEVEVLRVGQVKPGDCETVDLVIIGSPTHGGRPTEAMQDLLNKVPASALQGTDVATFDTRTPPTILSRIFGYAAPRIADRLEKKGGTLLVPPEDFFVQGIKGPLNEGELERAAGWARELTASME